MFSYASQKSTKTTTTSSSPQYEATDQELYGNAFVSDQVTSQSATESGTLDAAGSTLGTTSGSETDVAASNADLAALCQEALSSQALQGKTQVQKMVQVLMASGSDCRFYDLGEVNYYVLWELNNDFEAGDPITCGDLREDALNLMARDGDVESFAVALEGLYDALVSGVKQLLSYSVRYGQGRSVSYTALHEWMYAQMINPNSVYSAYPEA